MAERRGLLTRWRCARMRPWLVDCADGALEGEARVRVERHAAECGDCRDALAALREVAQALRQSPAPRRDGEFFRLQRQAILRRVRQAPPPRPLAAPFRPRFGLVAGLATAAVAMLILLRQPPEPPVAVPPPASMAGTSPRDIADLSFAADADLAVSTELGDELIAFGAAPLGDGEEWAPEPDVHDLSDQELERLEELIG